MKKIVSLTLALLLLCSLGVPALAEGLGGFSRDLTYLPGQFSDVKEGDWFASNVAAVYEYGIMNGVPGGRFDTDGEVSFAQAVTVACRIHQGYYETEDDLASGDPWYAPYLAYARSNDIADVSDELADEPIDRCDFACILSAALPDEALQPINTVEDGTLPDVSIYQDYSEAVYRLYRAGVLTGNENGLFCPYKPISRVEAATIISRIVDPSLRKSVSLRPAPFRPVASANLRNLKSLRMKTTDEEFRQAYDEAVKLVAPIAQYSREDQLHAIAVLLRQRFDAGMSYSMTTEHYNDPYGYFVLGSASCAGCTRATGLCLSILDIPYEHVNENQYSHQWCRVPVGDTYWISDAYGLYCGPEPAPYQHPYF